MDLYGFVILFLLNNQLIVKVFIVKKIFYFSYFVYILMYVIFEVDFCCYQVVGLDCLDYCGDLQFSSFFLVLRYYRNQGLRSKYFVLKCKLYVVLLVYLLYILGVKVSFRKKKCIFYFVYFFYQICFRVIKQYQRKVFIDVIYCFIRQYGD